MAVNFIQRWFGMLRTKRVAVFGEDPTDATKANVLAINSDGEAAVRQGESTGGTTQEHGAIPTNDLLNLIGGIAANISLPPVAVAAGRAVRAWLSEIGEQMVYKSRLDAGEDSAKLLMRAIPGAIPVVKVNTGVVVSGHGIMSGGVFSAGGAGTLTITDNGVTIFQAIFAAAGELPIPNHIEFSNDLTIAAVPTPADVLSCSLHMIP